MPEPTPEQIEEAIEIQRRWGDWRMNIAQALAARDARIAALEERLELAMCTDVVRDKRIAKLEAVRDYYVEALTLPTSMPLALQVGGETPVIEPERVGAICVERDALRAKLAAVREVRERCARWVTRLDVEGAQVRMDTFRDCAHWLDDALGGPDA